MIAEKLIDFSIPIGETVLDAASKIQSNSSRAVIVISGGKAVGVVSEGDILRTLLHGGSVYARIETCFRPSFKYLTSYNLEQAWALVREHGITLIPVIEAGGELADVITLDEIYKQLLFRR